MAVYPVENGYAMRGIAPRDLKDHPESVRLMYWSWIVELGLRAKDKELSQGLDANGRPLRAITAATRKHRRSMMTPTGKGDPNAPPLMPGRALSRTRSLLSGRAYPDHAEWFWRFDPFTGRNWADTLEDQRDRWGRDVFGVSLKAQRLMEGRAAELWSRWKRGLPVAQVRGAIIPMAPAVQRPPPPKEEGGNEAWRRLFAEPAKAAQPGRPGAPGNVLLTHIFEAGEPPRAKAVVVVPPKPKPPMMVRVAMPSKPKPAPAVTSPRPVQPEIAKQIAKQSLHANPAIAEAQQFCRDRGIPCLVLSTRKEALAIFGARTDSTQAAYYPAKDAILINAHGLGWSDASYLERANKTGLFVGDSYRDVMTHEMGHYWHRGSMDLKVYGEFRLLPVPDELNVASLVSRYGATSQAEFVAEVYTGLVKGKSYPKGIMDFYRKLKGPIP